MAVCWTTSAQQVTPLYPGVAPGSESWTWNEAENNDNFFRTRVVYNVSRPTITAYLPNPWSANGTAVVIFPGGGFHTLSIDSEGIDVARWLNERGVAAFVVKYRLVHSLTEDPVKELVGKMSVPGKMDADNEPVIPLAIQDGRTAIAWVRSHAKELNVNPSRIGIMGFSAGGTVATACLYNYNAENRPDFAAPIYPYIRPQAKGTAAADAPPVFIVAATDDQLGLAPHSVQLYSDWISNKHEAELHMYGNGGHGFGMRVQDIPTDTWIDRFGDWLLMRGLLKPSDPNHWMNKFTPQQLIRMKKEGDERTRNDWANLSRFAADNKKVAAPAAGENRVVFMGNSITEGWGNLDPDFFKGKPYINRGISGQTTPQMLLRFHQDVIALQPKVVVILAGTNDIAGNTGPTTLEQIMDNLTAMAELAQSHGIKVVLSSVVPAFDYPWRPGLQPAEKIFKLNQMIRSWADQHQCVYVDYFSAMADERKGLRAGLGDDGVHPNLAGYRIMEPLVEKAISQALKK